MDEFKQHMSSKFGSEVDVQAAFNKFDVNQDGVLDLEEMEAVKRDLEERAVRERAAGGGGLGVRSEVLEAQLERIEAFVVAVHGSCGALHEETAQVSARQPLLPQLFSPGRHLFPAAIQGFSRAFPLTRVCQNAASIKGVLSELQALNANMQLLQSRISKMSSGKSEEGAVRSKVCVMLRRFVLDQWCCMHRLLPPLVALPLSVTHSCRCDRVWGRLRRTTSTTRRRRPECSLELSARTVFQLTT